MAYYQGQTFQPGYVGQPGDVYEGCTFIATATLGDGTKLINCNFVCDRYWWGSCKSNVSTVGAGSTMSGGSASYVRFDSSGTWANVSQGEAATPPDCVDCPPQGNYGLVGGYTGAAVLVSTTGQSTASQWCEQTSKCGNEAIVIYAGQDADVTIDTHEGTRTA